MAAQHPYPVPVTGPGQGTVAPAASTVPVEVPDPAAKLSVKEKRVWDHVTASLRDCGLIHRTDAMMLTIICRTFIRWVDAEDELSKLIKEKGSYLVATPKGYEQPHQLFYLTRNLKRDLLQWLPEAALTIPSFQKVMGDRAQPNQADLFDDDPVESHRRRRTAAGLRAV
ncbi:P27 family phage terminase small subunit [Achromobacter pestifer]